MIASIFMKISFVVVAIAEQVLSHGSRENNGKHATMSENNIYTKWTFIKRIVNN